MSLRVIYDVTTAFRLTVTITAALAIADNYFSFIFLRFLFTLFFIKIRGMFVGKGGGFENA